MLIMLATSMSVTVSEQQASFAFKRRNEAGQNNSSQPFPRHRCVQRGITLGPRVDLCLNVAKYQLCYSADIQLVHIL